MESIRRATVGDGASLSDGFSLSSNEIEIVESDVHPVEPLIEDYPYDDQVIYSAEFKYRDAHPFEEEVYTSTGNISFRSGSKLFIIKTSTDTPSHTELVRRFNDGFDERVVIFPGTQISRESIWNFLRSADEKLSIDVITEGEMGNLENEDYFKKAEILEEGDVIVQNADVSFDYRGNKINVVYTSGTLSITGDDRHQREYIHQKFERALGGAR